MAKQKQENALSFKTSNAMDSRIEYYCGKENRAKADMAKILIAEALVARDSQDNNNTGKYL